MGQTGGTTCPSSEVWLFIQREKPLLSHHKKIITDRTLHNWESWKTELIWVKLRVLTKWLMCIWKESVCKVIHIKLRQALGHSNNYQSKLSAFGWDIDPSINLVSPSSFNKTIAADMVYFHFILFILQGKNKKRNLAWLSSTTSIQKGHTNQPYTQDKTMQSDMYWKNGSY